MTIRKIESKDHFEAEKLAAFCFHQRIELSEPDSQKIQEYEKDKRDGWGAFEDNTLIAQIINNPFEFYLDGKNVKAGGIGAVSTLPEYRDSGAIRQIFERLIPQTYTNGEVISALYPFNHKFYRKFGYEVIPFRNEYKFSPSVLKDYQNIPGSREIKIKRWKKDDDVSAFLEVYETFAKKMNLSARRTPDIMENHMKYEKEFIDRKFSYLFLMENKPIAYLIFTDVYNAEAAELKVDECAWTDRKSFYAILNFLSLFSADYGSITLPLPKGIDLLKIIRSPDAYNIEKRSCQHFMLRVINVQKLLETIKKPADCDFTIRIEDELIKENNLTLRVKANEVIPVTEEKADIELNIRALAQLASGCSNIDEALLRDDVEINSNEDMLRKVFTEKMIFVSESF
ncbi:MAG: GNAT family N-acetyltransferase [Treponema sp.]|nr:GNAT family N-acetyltransferase [Treponema sp.]